MVNSTFKVRFLVFTVITMLGVNGMYAQVNGGYTFLQSSGTYSPIAGTVVSFSGITTAWLNNTTSLSLPFNFAFNGITYASGIPFYLYSNGFIEFSGSGINPSGMVSEPISGGYNWDGDASALGCKLGSSSTAITYTTLGTAPNRSMVIQWTGAIRYVAGVAQADNLNFQIILYENTNVVEFVYGCSTASATVSGAQVGLRGLRNTDFVNRKSSTAWTGTQAGKVNTDSITISSSVVPTCGLTYDFIPCAGSPASPPVNTTNPAAQSICAGSSTTLTATGTGTLSWYNTSAGGGYLQTGDTLVIPVLDTTTTFYVLDSNSCGASPLTPIAVTVNPALTTNNSISITCGDSASLNGIYYHLSGTYSDTLTGTSGCDSIITLQLTVTGGDTTNIADTICSGDSVLFNGIWYDQSGTYNAHFTSSSGCDSVVSLQLSLNPSFNNSNSLTISCGDSASLNGVYYYLPGTYSDTLMTINGCDSIITLQLTVARNTTPPNDTILTICPDSTYSNNCNNIIMFIAHFQSPVDSFHWRVFNPYESDSSWTNGDTVIYDSDTIQIGIGGGVNVQVMGRVNYSLCLITFRYCGSDSICELFDVPESVQSISADNTISIYPNPANNLLYIKTEGLHLENILIYDVDGQTVAKQSFTPQIDIHNLTPGVYLLEVNSKEGVARKRWVKM